jgi:ATP-dependent helicase/nuclease subunit B
VTLFAPVEGPRVFALPPGVDFSRALIAGLDARLAGQPPEATARVEIWVNTQRARRALAAKFATGPARLLPRIRVVTELADDPLGPDLPPPVPALRRKLELARLVGRLIVAEPELAPGTAVFDLADSLGELLDELQGEGIAPEVFAAVDAAEHAAHWQRSLRFLELIAGYSAAGGADGQGRMRASAEALAAAWEVAPPGHPVIVAGSTGSRGATRAFMAAVARLPQGALVLPGFDAGLPAAVWRRLGADDAGAADHPQHGFRRLADALGFDPAAVPAWHPVAPPAPERNALVSLALRPAPVTDQWRSEGGALAGSLGAAAAGLSWVEAPDPRGEALAIALVLREAAEVGARAALVTPDRVLARRVTAELDRWGLIPDDSAGRPLALTPPGVLLRLLAALPGVPLTPEALLVLLKHPLVNSGPGARGGHLGLTARLETGRLRGGAPWIDWPDLAAWATDTGGAAPDWIAWLRAALVPLGSGGRRPLAEHVARHRAVAEALAAGPSARAHELWEKEAGLQARALLDALAAEADAGGVLDAADYRALVQSLMAARDVPEEAVVTHPGIAIWGTLEARVQSADRIVLGGLNEGIWPRLPGADAWLGRAIRRAVGLPSPERQIGLSAHDFQQAMGAAQVVLTRATRDAEAPTVASRWLLRLENLLLGLGAEGAAALGAAKARGAGWLAQAGRLDAPQASVPPEPRPAPRPPAAARPVELSVTQVETLVKDPYAVYARHVLRLRRLDPPGRKADALTRGSAIHTALDAFVTATVAGLPEDADAVFRAEVRKALAEAAPWPAVNAIWEARLGRSASWFLDSEAVRRARACPAAREVRGRREVAGLPLPFAVTAKADRLDRAADGTYAIYDYKSGTAPSASEAAANHLQLPLEALIAEAGGFEGLAAGRAAHLELIGINGRSGLPLDAEPAALAAFWERFRELIRHYQDPATGFVARLRPQRLKYPGDYDHLSRKGEWADGDPPGGGW